MKTLKQVLRPERLRQVPAQFSWVDQRLVARHFIDRCDARTAALYLFLVTVSDAQGLSYYGASTLMQRLHLSAAELEAARQQLIALELLAYRAPLYQVLSLPGTAVTPRAIPNAPTSAGRNLEGPVSLAQLLDQMERRRARL